MKKFLLREVFKISKKKKFQSVEPNIADLANGWLKSYGLDYKLEQESLSHEIDTALSEYFSKSGGSGGNRPDVKILLECNLKKYPVLIEYKGYKDKLIKLDGEGKVENRKANSEPHYSNIKNFAVNGAVHYANAILHYTNYTEIIAIGMTGWRDDSKILQHEISVYYVSKKNFGLGQEVGKYTDFSFLKSENFPQFIEEIKKISLTEEELARLKNIREAEIDASLIKLNNDIYNNEQGLSEQDRIYLVVASIMATLGVPDKVSPLEKNNLKSSTEKGETDGEILMRKVENFLSERNLPADKKMLIIRTLQNTVTSSNINKVINGETQLKRVFSKIIDDLGIYYKIGLTTDFTGKLFNEMYNWLGFTQDKLNDVVITPPYVAKLLVKLARTNKDSYVWDYATGSAGLLVAAMNEMIIDARKKIKSPDELRQKENFIRANQILGLEILPSIYMLAVLNMILMGDGSSKILNLNSLTDFNENYPADVFVLNPPYSAPGNGMIFVAAALSKMQKGYAAIIIQNSAGSGKAIYYNKKILERNTLLASIKMPIDLFIGKSSVQTNIYVFRVGEPHEKDFPVKFIDFSNDGYKRTNRKKSRQNLQDIDHAQERYDELVSLVKFGKHKLHHFTEKDYYEGTIDPTSGKDWNQSAPIDSRPTLADFKKTVSDYLAFEVTNILKNSSADNEKKNSPLNEKLNNLEWKEFKIGDLFEKINLKFKRRKFDKRADISTIPTKEFSLPLVNAKDGNNGIMYYGREKDWEFAEMTIDIVNDGAVSTANVYSQPQKTGILYNAYLIKPKFIPTAHLLHFFTTAIYKSIKNKFGYEYKASWNRVSEEKIFLPTKNGKIDFEFMEKFIEELEAERIEELEAERIEELEAYLSAAGLKDTILTAEENFALENFCENLGEFSLSQIFNEIHQGKRLKKDDQIAGKIPFVMSGVTNLGVVGYISNPVASFPKNSITIDIFGNTFYRNYDFGAGDDTGVYWNSEKNYSAKTMLFFAATIQKSLTGKFSYGNKLRSSQSKDFKIYLPEKDGEPNFEFMEKFISAVQKIVIADVVKYSEEKISAYKKAVK